MKALAHAVPGAVAELLRSAPLSPGKVSFAWNSAVGPAVQRATRVLLDGGTLRVEASTEAWAREISRSAPTIVRRLQSLLGPDVVKRIEVRRA